MLTRDTAFRHLGPLWLCPLHHTQSRGGPFYSSCSGGHYGVPPRRAARCLQAASVQPVTSGMRGLGGDGAHCLPLFSLTQVRP
jgi:hypothetical protein